MGKVLKFFHLTGSEKLIFCRAVYLLFYYRIALRRQHFQSLVDQLSNSTTTALLQTVPSIPADTLIRLLAAACRIVPFTTCLSRAMAGQMILTGCGYFSRLHVGVAREKEEELEAHAWLSLDGRIILGNVPDLDRYRELPLYQGRGTKGS
ncbi:MAG: lasso peptide biosynthesis B2 protein [Desulfobulbaceae bacterium]|nr:lasso peptide biosynthesis B2 protein [Desulfobulbaceae bacterium]